MAIAILDYEMGNLRSVARAVARVGGEPLVTADPGEVAKADGIVIPGVGAFGACMRALTAAGLDGAIPAFVETGRPALGVCLGMQVLFEASEEDPEPGLGLLPGHVTRIRGDVKIPHMGWNEVRWVEPHPYTKDIPDGSRFYFVHSYATEVADGVTVGVTEHGGAFSAVVARDNLFATQFHPEKSGDVGLAIYEAFVKDVGA
jgi:glutamine amidotransferase